MRLSSIFERPSKESLWQALWRGAASNAILPAAAIVGAGFFASELQPVTTAPESQNMLKRFDKKSQTYNKPLEFIVTGSIYNDFKNAGIIKESFFLLKPELAVKLNKDPQARELMNIIQEEATQRNLNIILFANQMFHESIGFKPSYVYGPGKSPKGAMGIAQIMPETGKANGLKTPEDFFDPKKSVAVAAKIMQKLTEKYNGDQILAMAAYNGGERAVNFVRSELGKDEITSQEWLAFMTDRFIAFGGKNRDTWHMQTRLYIKDIANINWSESYKSRALLSQGTDPMSYISSLKGAPTKNIALKQIENILK